MMMTLGRYESTTDYYYYRLTTESIIVTHSVADSVDSVDSVPRGLLKMPMELLALPLFLVVVVVIRGVTRGHCKTDTNNTSKHCKK
jgi:hypothetical protein